MDEKPNPLRSVFSAPIVKEDDSFVIEIPRREVENNSVKPGDTYRIAVIRQQYKGKVSESDTVQEDANERSSPLDPPVDEGDMIEVTINSLGKQGDGIAKVDRGYVIIVPDTQPGEQPIVEIENVHENFAFAKKANPD